MLESSFPNLGVVNCLPDLLVVQLRRFTASLIEQGYARETVRLKVKLVTDFGEWLKRNRVAVADLDERRVEAFLKHRRRVHKGNLKTLQQFLAHLRRQNVVPARKLPCDRSPLAQILNRYETHLRTERGLVAHTILEYQSFVRKFLLERFHRRPLLLKALKASDISDFILRHTPGMDVRRAQVMTTAFRSFFRFLFQKVELQADLAASVPTVANWRCPLCLSTWFRRKSNVCSRPATAAQRSVAATMPSFFCLPVWVFAPGKWLLSNSRTSTGELAKSLFGARGCFTNGCPCLPMWVRLWLPACVETVLAVKRVEYSFARRRHAGVLRTLPHCRRSSAEHSLAQTYTLLSREPICFVTAWQLPCCAPGPKWEKSQRSFGIERSIQLRSTPRSTSRACGHWLTTGQWEVHSETIGTGIEGLP
jgi:Phage integrase, N-terminal SAM-like domain